MYIFEASQSRATRSRSGPEGWRDHNNWNFSLQLAGIVKPYNDSCQLEPNPEFGTMDYFRSTEFVSALIS